MALQSGSAALLPLDQFLELAEVEFQVDSSGVYEAVLYPGRREIRIDPQQSLGWVDEAPFRLLPQEMVQRDGQVYVASTVLGRLLDLEFRADWLDYSVVVMNPEDLPLGRRLAREARWNALRAEREGTLGIPRLELDQKPVGGAVLDWSLFTDAREPLNSLAYSAGLGARVMGGKLRLSSQSLGPAADGSHRFDATYQLVLQDRKWLRQVRLGDGFGTGPRLREMRGFALTNSPLIRPSFFGVEGIAGRVGPGWEVELRRSGRTLDLTRADEEGAFALDIPVRYGENTVQVVAFGPHGQVVTSDRLLLLSRNRLPEGQLEWGLSGGACRSRRCRWTGNADVWYGVNNSLTVRAGTEAFGRDTLPSLVQPYVGVTGMPLRGLELSGEAVYAGFLRAGANYSPSPRFRVRTAFTSFSQRALEPILHARARRTTTEADVFFRPRRDDLRLFVRGSFLRQRLETTTLTTLQLSTTVPVDAVQVEGGLRRTVDAPVLGGSRTDDFPFAAASGLVPISSRDRIWVRGEMEFAGLTLERLNRVRAQAAYQVNGSLQVQTGMTWDQTMGATFDLGVTAFLSPMQSVTQIIAGAANGTQATQLNRGTINWNETTRRFSFDPGPGVDRGGITGRVFVDSNGNGIRELGEEGLPGVRLMVGGERVATGPEGDYSAWDLLPFQPVRVSADSTSIPNPVLVPSVGEVEVIVPPSSFGRVDIPVSASHEILGRVIQAREGVEVPLPRARLELVDFETGAVTPFTAFSDGEFYRSGVRPGRWILRVAPAWAEAAGLRTLGEPKVIERVPSANPEPVGPLVIRVGSPNVPGPG
jgi:hypothetical protein